jgi:putative transposase
MMQSAEQLAEEIGVSKACLALRVPRSSYYRALGTQGKPVRVTSKQSRSSRALSQAEQEEVRQTLNSERFQDCAPREVYAALLDEGQYLCHWRTMYRILADHDEVRERRDQLRHPNYVKPELLATKPNELWSWDITKFLGPVKWVYYYLYVILDVFSRYVVGWMVAERETGTLAKELIAETCTRQRIESHQLTIHSDRGSPMTSKSVAQLIADLGITKSHSRPYTSTDNPFSEAQFKTMKYRPDYPDRFGSLQDVRLWARPFFHWYNYEHHHGGLGLMVPADVHYGRAQAVIQARQDVLRAAYVAHPERFVIGLPKPPQLPEAVWINPPKNSAGKDTMKAGKDSPDVVVEAVDPVGNSERSGELSISPQPEGQNIEAATITNIEIRA